MCPVLVLPAARKTLLFWGLFATAKAKLCSVKNRIDVGLFGQPAGSLDVVAGEITGETRQSRKSSDLWAEISVWWDVVLGAVAEG